MDTPTGDGWLNWMPIATAPATCNPVLVAGPSGMGAPRDKSITIAYREPEYRGDRWLDLGGDGLGDSGLGAPTHWARVPNWPDIENALKARRRAESLNVSVYEARSALAHLSDTEAIAVVKSFGLAHPHD